MAVASYERWLKRTMRTHRDVSSAGGPIVAQVPLTPDIQASIARRIESYASEAPEPLRWLSPYVAAFDALPLLVGWWDATGIRTDGAIICWSTEGEYPGVKPVKDRYHWLSALVDGCRWYPELRTLLPTRPRGAV